MTPIAGKAIADTAWEAYTAAFDTWRGGKGAIVVVARTRREWDRAQAGIEQAAGRELASEAQRRRRGL